MILHIGICDDSPEDICVLSQALSAYDSSIRISTYRDGKSLLEECEDNLLAFDLLFIDIYMPGMNGITTAQKIRVLREDIKIIFISSSNDHYQDTYDIFAFNYIMKPLNVEKLYRIMDQALLSVFEENRQKLIVSFKNVDYQIFVRDIHYIESSSKRICVNMSDGKQVICYKKLDELEELLPEAAFVRCHQSYIVNFFYVTEMTSKYFSIGTAKISISRKYWKTAKEKYFSHLFSQMDKKM